MFFDRKFADCPDLLTLKVLQSKIMLYDDARQKLIIFFFLLHGAKLIPFYRLL